MTYIATGLNNGGVTAHHRITYNSSMSLSDGPIRTNQLVNACDSDFALMESWFTSVKIPFKFPMTVQVENRSHGGSALLRAITLPSCGKITMADTTRRGRRQPSQNSN